MTDAERDKIAMDVFAAVLDEPADRRAAVVAKRCGDDVELRRRVERLLSVDGTGLDAAADAFLLDAVQKHDSGSEAPTIDATQKPLATDDILGAGDEMNRQGGSYRILRVVGEGGMGTVFEAEQTNPRRRVAIKAIRNDLRSSAARRRFEYEAQVLARLEHPGIARLYEADARPEEGRIRAYLAMEFVDGLPLDRFAEDNKLTLSQRIELFCRVCDAVSYAHRRGVIHRDLKPANILVTQEGQPKVLDFGVARTIGEDDPAANIAETRIATPIGTRLTQVGQIIGTLAFMSPEQLDASAPIDTRSDVYALGVVLYLLLTGKLPIDTGTGGLMSAASRVITQVPDRLSVHDRQFRGDVEAIVAKALEKDPARRYASVEQFSEDLQRFRDGRPVEALSGSPLYVLRKNAWRYRKYIVAAGVGVAALGGFSIYAAVQSARNAELAGELRTALSDARRLADEKSSLAANEASSRAQAIAARAEAESRATDLRRGLYIANVGFARGALDRGDAARARQLLDACPPDLRNWEWSLLDQQVDRSDRTLRIAAIVPGFSSAHADAELRTLALGYSGGYLIIRLGDGKTISQGKARSPVTVTVSPDGLSVLAASTDELRLVDAINGNTIWKQTFPSLPPGPRRYSILARFTDDGTQLAVLDVFGTLLSIRASDGLIIGRTAKFVGATAMEIVPGTQQVYLGKDTGQIIRTNLAGDDVHDLAKMKNRVVALAVSADGKSVASLDTEQDMALWDPAEPSRPKRRIVGEWPLATQLCLNTDGSKLMFAARDSVCRMADVPSGMPPENLVGHTAKIGYLRVAANGQRLMTVGEDGTIKFWTLPVPTVYAPTARVGGLNTSLAVLGTTEPEAILAGRDRPYAWSIVKQTGGRKYDVPPGSPPPYFQIAGDSAGKLVFGTGMDGIYHIWDHASGKLLRSMPVGGTGSWAVCFSPNSRTLVSGDRSGDIRAWDIQTGDELPSIKAPFSGLPMSAVFNPDGDVLMVGGPDGQVHQYAWPSRQLIRKVHIGTGRVFSMAYSADGRKIAIAAELEPATLRNAATLEVLHTLAAAGEDSGCVAFHPNCERVAVGGGDGVVRIWDTTAGVELMSLRSGAVRTSRVVFSADGRHLVTLGEDGQARVWSARVSPPTPPKP